MVLLSVDQYTVYWPTPWPSGAGHRGHDEAMETGGREFDPRPGHYSMMSF